MRPTGRIVKLSGFCPIVVLKESDDGKLEADRVVGYSHNDKIKDAHIADSQSQDASSASELCAEIENRYSAGELGRKSSNVCAAKLLGYKNTSLTKVQRELVKSDARRKAWVFDCNQMMEIANIIARKQYLYLKSQIESDKVRLTYIEISNYFKEDSESTVRRLIQDMKLMVGSRAETIAASELIERSGKWEIYREIAVLREIYPQAGAPKLHALLKDKGYEVSRRTVGNALSLPSESHLLL